MPCDGGSLIDRMLLADDARLTDLTAQAAEALLARRLKLVTAESCTGGWLAKLCTDRPGSSRWFAHGLVSYSNAAKQRLLEVSAETLAHDGAVSQATVEAMAIGAKAHHPDIVSVAISGVAGPDGGTTQKPVGLVWCAWALPCGAVHSAAEHFAGDRDAVRRQSLVLALTGLVSRLGEKPQSG